MTRDAARARDILNAIEDIRGTVQGLSRANLSIRDVRVKAILYSFIVIGEAARALSPAFKDRLPDIPWPAIIALRNHIVHEYDKVALETIWDIMTLHLDPLENALRRQVPDGMKEEDAPEFLWDLPEQVRP